MKIVNIEKLKQKFNGRSFSTKDAKGLGVSTRMLSFYAKNNYVQRVGRGLYMFQEFESDEDFQFLDVALRSKAVKESVICLISALSYWDITDEIPRDHWLAIPNNYSIPKDSKKIKIIRPRDLITGVIWKEIAGQVVRITTPERSVCDAFKYLDEETAITALRSSLENDEYKSNFKYLLEIAKKTKSPKVLEILKELTVAKAKDYPKMSKEVFRESTKWLSENYEVVS